MQVKKLFLAAVLAALPAALAAQSAARIDRGPLPGFVLGHEQDQGIASIAEYVPEGETVEDWSRMVTVQYFGPRVAQGQTAPGFIDRMQELIAGACPGARYSRVSQFSDDGVPGAAMRSDCPLNPQTRLPETTFFRVYSQANSLYIVQAAFRSVPDADEAAWAESYLETVHLCEGNCR